MSEQLQLRRGTAAALASFAPAPGEIAVDQTNNRICIGDGATLGGWPAAKLAEVPQIAAVLNTLATGAFGGTFQAGVIDFAQATASGTSITCGTQIPANCIVFGVGVRVATTVTTSGSPTQMNIGSQASQGDPSPSATRFGYLSVSANAIGAGSTGFGLISPAAFNATALATNILLAFTGGASPAFTAGVLHLSIHYAIMGAPTS